MKNDTTFVRMRSGDHLGGAKMSKKAPRSVELNFVIINNKVQFDRARCLFSIYQLVQLNCDIDKNGFRRTKEESQIYESCLRFFYLCPAT